MKELITQEWKLLDVIYQNDSSHAANSESDSNINSLSSQKQQCHYAAEFIGVQASSYL